jgi:hypothetical protein
MTCVTLSDWTEAHHQAAGQRHKALNLEGEERRRVYWKTIEAQRAGYIARHTNLFFDLLQRLKKDVLQAARGTVLVEHIPSAVEHALRGHEADYREEVLRLYRSVWPIFAERTRDGLRGKQPGYAHWVRKRISHRTAEPSRKQGGEGWMREAQSFVSNEGGVLIREPTQATKQAIMEATRTAVSEGLEEGEGAEAIARRIDNNTSRVVSRTRARRIARTETIRASNRASISGAQRASQETGQNLLKDWIATRDSRVRSSHASADGQTVPLNETFTVGGFSARYPADPQLPPRLSVNCRCTLAYVKKNE